MVMSEAVLVLISTLDAAICETLCLARQRPFMNTCQISLAVGPAFLLPLAAMPRSSNANQRIEPDPMPTATHGQATVNSTIRNPDAQSGPRACSLTRQLCGSADSLQAVRPCGHGLPPACVSQLPAPRSCTLTSNF